MNILLSTSVVYQKKKDGVRQVEKKSPDRKVTIRKKETSKDGGSYNT